MKSLNPLFFTAMLFIGAEALHAQTPAPAPAQPPTDGKPVPQRAMIVKYSLLVPADKTSERVKPGERNPFGKSEENNVAAFKGTNEENVIRDLLVKLRASGASFEKDDTRVMLGDMILRPGQLVPKVLASQTLALRVAKIKHDSIELQWVEKKYSGLPPRILTIPVDLRPVVHYKLQGQAGSAGKPEIANVKGMKMGEQIHSELVEDPAGATEPNSVPKSKLGSAWQGEDSPTIIASEPPPPALPAKLPAGVPPLARVSLETVSRFIPKTPKPDGTLPEDPSTPPKPDPR